MKRQPVNRGDCATCRTHWWWEGRRTWQEMYCRACKRPLIAPAPGRGWSAIRYMSAIPVPPTLRAW